MFLFFDLLLLLVILVVLIVAFSYIFLLIMGFLIDYNLKRGKNPEKWLQYKAIIEKNLGKYKRYKRYRRYY